MCSVYQAFSPPLEGPGNEARLGAAGSAMVLQQWCAITLSPGVLSLHTQQSVHFRPFSIVSGHVSGVCMWYVHVHT